MKSGEFFLTQLPLFGEFNQTSSGNPYRLEVLVAAPGLVVLHVHDVLGRGLLRPDEVDQADEGEAVQAVPGSQDLKQNKSKLNFGINVSECSSMYVLRKGKLKALSFP